MNLKTRILALEQSAFAAQDGLMGNGFDFNVYLKKTQELEQEMNAIDKAAGAGLVVGRSLSFGVGDGSANYIVTKVRKNEVTMAFIPLMDGYQFNGCYENSKGELCLPRQVAERQCRINTGLKAIFS